MRITWLGTVGERRQPPLSGRDFPPQSYPSQDRFRHAIVGFRYFLQALSVRVAPYLAQAGAPVATCQFDSGGVSRPTARVTQLGAYGFRRAAWGALSRWAITLRDLLDHDSDAISAATVVLLVEGVAAIAVLVVYAGLAVLGVWS